MEKMIFQWVQHILSIEACDAIRRELNCFILMINSVATLCGFAPLLTPRQGTCRRLPLERDVLYIIGPTYMLISRTQCIVTNCSNSLLIYLFQESSSLL